MPTDNTANSKAIEGRFSEIWPLHSTPLALETKFGLQGQTLEDALSTRRMREIHNLLFRIHQTNDEYKGEFGRATKVGWGYNFEFRMETRNPALPRITPEEAVRALKAPENEVAEVATDAVIAQAQKELEESEVKHRKAMQFKQIREKKRALDEETAEAERCLLESPSSPQEEKKRKTFGPEGESLECGKEALSREVDELNKYVQAIVNDEPPVGSNEYVPEGSKMSENEGPGLFEDPLLPAGFENALLLTRRTDSDNKAAGTSDNTTEPSDQASRDSC